VLASVKRTADERQRSTTIYALLRAQQLQGFEGKASVRDWIKSGSGTAEQVVAELAAERDEAAAQQARCTRFCELLEAEGLSSFPRFSVPACREYIHNNTGSEARLWQQSGQLMRRPRHRSGHDTSAAPASQTCLRLSSCR
jgi:predicted cupin superfamily sugar epimerase